MSLQFYLVLACAGGVGAVCRFSLGQFAIRVLDMPTPWPTMLVNCVGALLIGMLAQLFTIRASESVELQFWLISGLLGGFTTFSAFSLETVQLIQAGHWTEALAYVCLSVLLCALMCMAGMQLVRFV
jgi:fluoride exporter